MLPFCENIRIDLQLDLEAAIDSGDSSSLPGLTLTKVMGAPLPPEKRFPDMVLHVDCFQYFVVLLGRLTSGAAVQGDLKPGAYLPPMYL